MRLILCVCIFQVFSLSLGVIWLSLIAGSDLLLSTLCATLNSTYSLVLSLIVTISIF